MSKTRNAEDTLFFSLSLEYLETYMPKQLGRSAKTIKSHRDALTVFRRFLVEKKNLTIFSFAFKDCTPELIQDFVIHLKEQGNSPGTCNGRLASIRTYIWFAADRNVALQSVAIRISKIPKCKEPKTEKKILSQEEMSCILRQPPNTKLGLRDRTMMVLLYDSAIRLDELLSLRIQDISLDCDDPYIFIHGKGNKERIVAGCITKSGVTDLKDHNHMRIISRLGKFIGKEKTANRVNGAGQPFAEHL